MFAVNLIFLAIIVFLPTQRGFGSPVDDTLYSGTSFVQNPLMDDEDVSKDLPKSQYDFENGFAAPPLTKRTHAALLAARTDHLLQDALKDMSILKRQEISDSLREAPQNGPKLPFSLHPDLVSTYLMLDKDQTKKIALSRDPSLDSFVEAVQEGDDPTLSETIREPEKTTHRIIFPHFHYQDTASERIPKSKKGKKKPKKKTSAHFRKMLKKNKAQPKFTKKFSDLDDGDDDDDDDDDEFFLSKLLRKLKRQSSPVYSFGKKHSKMDSDEDSLADKRREQTAGSYGLMKNTHGSHNTKPPTQISDIQTFETGHNRLTYIQNKANKTESGTTKDENKDEQPTEHFRPGAVTEKVDQTESDEDVPLKEKSPTTQDPADFEDKDAVAKMVDEDSKVYRNESMAEIVDGGTDRIDLNVTEAEGFLHHLIHGRRDMLAAGCVVICIGVMVISLSLGYALANRRNKKKAKDSNNNRRYIDLGLHRRRQRFMSPQKSLFASSSDEDEDSDNSEFDISDSSKERHH